MNHSIGNIRDLYALFSLSNPELIQPLKSKIVQRDIVASKIISANNLTNAFVSITTIDEKKYHFMLDLAARIYQSKGDWIWATQIEIIYANKPLLHLVFTARVIDIPYAGSNICAHWLLRNVKFEINELFITQLPLNQS